MVVSDQNLTDVELETFLDEIGITEEVAPSKNVKSPAITELLEEMIEFPNGPKPRPSRFPFWVSVGVVCGFLIGGSLGFFVGKYTFQSSELKAFRKVAQTLLLSQEPPSEEVIEPLEPRPEIEELVIGEEGVAPESVS